MIHKPNVLVVCASIRSTGKKDEELKAIVENSNSQSDILDFFNTLSHKESIAYSNSEIISSIAMIGAKSTGANVDYFSLRRLFKVTNSLRIDRVDSLGLDDEMFYIDTTKIEKKSLEHLIKKVKRADSIILSTPVYFGDRSSVADYFLKLLHKRRLLEKKAFSVISVGAKRNGGQETTNIYALFDAINMGAYGVGNGPKTSQYGGTCVGGDRGSVIKDEYGLETSFGTGKRSAQVAKIVSIAKEIQESEFEKVKIGILISADNIVKDVQKKVEALLLKIDNPLVDFEIINLIDHKVERCIACNVCPYPQMIKNGSRGKTHLGKTDYACIIDNGRDSVEVIRESLKNIRGLIVVSVNDDNITDLVDQYQSFMERSRFIRRNDFEWMNTVFTSLIFKNDGSSRDRLFGLRSTTSYMRHNTIITAPNRVLTLEGKIISSSEKGLNDFVDAVLRLSLARKRTTPIEVSYIAGGSGGYADVSLDHTAATRE